jgi:hypothetical protein
VKRAAKPDDGLIVWERWPWLRVVVMSLTFLGIVILTLCLARGSR